MRITDMGMVVLEPTRPLDPARASERWRCGAVMDFASAYPESTVSPAGARARPKRAGETVGRRRLASAFGKDRTMRTVLRAAILCSIVSRAVAETARPDPAPSL